jgi:DNA-binding NarL/FixJ family response regulator
VQGKSNKEIARALNLGEGTVKVHVAALFRVLGVTSRSAAAAAGSRLMGGA